MNHPPGEYYLLIALTPRLVIQSKSGGHSPLASSAPPSSLLCPILRSKRLTCVVYTQRLPCSLVSGCVWAVGGIDKRREGEGGQDVYSASSLPAGLMVE